MDNGRTYVHATPPQPVGVGLHGKGLYREDDDVGNIMYDRRIVRGNTYAAQVVTQQQQREVERVRNENERRLRREAARRRRMEKGQESGTPRAVEGRRHCEAQTETYLEVLTDKPPEVEVETQTDGFIEKKTLGEPLYMPAKTGIDVETEIAPGELFDFDEEVKPILEVLVGKTLQVSMLEVLEEEELANIRARQIEFEQMRDIELAEVQRLDAQASRREAEKQRRLQQESERLQLQADLEHKIAARNFAKQYFSALANSVFDDLVDAGIFFDPIINQVQTHFMPWLMDNVVYTMKNHTSSRACADAILASAIKHADSLAPLICSTQLESNDQSPPSVST